MDHFGKA